jgi:hypothetical protein
MMRGTGVGASQPPEPGKMLRAGVLAGNILVCSYRWRDTDLEPDRDRELAGAAGTQHRTLLNSEASARSAKLAPGKAWVRAAGGAPVLPRAPRTRTRRRGAASAAAVQARDEAATQVTSGG